MTPTSALPSGQTRVASFRRGRLLTLLVVVGSALLLLEPGVLNLIYGYPPDDASHHGTNVWTDFLFGAAIIFILCNGAWRGGRSSTGCLAFIYGGLLAGFVFSLATVLTFFAFGAHIGVKFNAFNLDPGNMSRGPGHTLSFLAFGAWAAFSCWVLLFSLDARFYRSARQQLDPSFDQWHQRHSKGSPPP